MIKTTQTGPEAAQQARGNFTPPRYAAGPSAAASQSDHATVPAPSGSRLSPHNWRVRTRLNAILLIPVLVALIVGGINVKNSRDQWQQEDDALRTANLVRAAATYGNDLINERDVSVVPLLQGDTQNPQVRAARAATDQAARAFDAAVAHMPDTPDLKRRLATFRRTEPQLARLRQNAYTSALPGVQTEEGYVAVQHPLMGFANDLGYGTDTLTSYGRILYAISLAKAAESLTLSIGEHILVQKQTSVTDYKTQLTALASYAYLQQIAIQEYQASGTPDEMALLQQAENSAQQQGRQQLALAKQQAQAAGQPFVAPPELSTMVKAIVSGASPSELRAQGITPESYFAAATLAFNAYRTIEQHLTDQAAGRAAHLSSSAKADAIIDAAAVLTALLLAFLIASLMARSMSRSMRRLRNSAFEIAEQQLPALVDQLSRTALGRVNTRVAPIPINTSDEIGEVARAFDQVHREAVRLAAEQALLRGNVNAIFTNLSLRNQGLIQRQLALITDLENNEAEPDQLKNLFHLDHLATRMRRNGDNLLVLAGEEPGRRWNKPVLLVDVIRAATSEVEQYERIETTDIPETEIHGAVVTDLVHLLAELLENATSFSSPQTKVRVTANRLSDGRLLVEILDHGIGLTSEDFADINHKLADPPIVDAAVSQRMGLFVVGRLAARHGIRVQLRPSGQQAGTTSLVILPEAITHGGGGKEMEQGDSTAAPIVSEHRDGAYQTANPTAAELSFDGRNYHVPDDARELDSVGRSLMREGRRAALAAATEGRPHADEGPQFRDEADAPAPPAAPSPPAAASYGEHGAPEEFQQQQYEPSHETAYQTAYETYQPSYSYEQEHPEPETSQSAASPTSEPALPGGPQEPTGHGARDAIPSDGDQLLTDAGLPRRQRQWQPPDAAVPQRETASSASPYPQGAPPAVGRGKEAPPGAAGDEHLREGVRGEEPPGPDHAAQWRSANDEHWQRAEQVRKPMAGGVTPSGLPRRVPRANLVPGAARQTGNGGPQVSRAPADVGSRLAKLRRGVQQGRSAGSDVASTPSDSQAHGPNHQER